MSQVYVKTGLGSPPPPPPYILYETPLNVKVLRRRERPIGVYIYVDYVTVESKHDGVKLIMDLNKLGSVD